MKRLARQGVVHVGEIKQGLSKTCTIADPSHCMVGGVPDLVQALTRIVTYHHAHRRDVISAPGQIKQDGRNNQNENEREEDQKAFHGFNLIASKRE